MFRPHNRILLRGQASRIEKKKKREKEKEKKTKRKKKRRGREKKEREKKKEKGMLLAYSVDAGDLAEGNKNKTSLAGFHDLLTAQRNSTRDFSPSSTPTRPTLSSPCSLFQFHSTCSFLLVLGPPTRFNEVTDQRQFLNRVARSLFL